MSLARTKWDRQWARAKSEYHKKIGDEYGLLSYTYFVPLMSYLMYKHDSEVYCLAIIEPADKQRSCFQEVEVKNDRYFCSLIRQCLAVGEEMTLNRKAFDFQSVPEFVLAYSCLPEYWLSHE